MRQKQGKTSLSKKELYNLNTTASKPGSSVFITEVMEQEIFCLCSLIRLTSLLWKALCKQPVQMSFRR